MLAQDKYLLKFVHVERLGLERVHANSKCLIYEEALYMSRDAHDDRLALRRELKLIREVLSQILCHLNPVHFGHLYVSDDQTVPQSEQARVLHDLDCFLCRHAEVDLVRHVDADGLDDDLEAREAELLVVDDQDAIVVVLLNFLKGSHDFVDFELLFLLDVLVHLERRKLIDRALSAVLL